MLLYPPSVLCTPSASSLTVSSSLSKFWTSSAQICWPSNASIMLSAPSSLSCRISTSVNSCHTKDTYLQTPEVSHHQQTHTYRYLKQVDINIHICTDTWSKSTTATAISVFSWASSSRREGTAWSSTIMG